MKGHGRSLDGLLGFGLMHGFFVFVFVLVRLDEWIVCACETGRIFWGLSL